MSGTAISPMIPLGIVAIIAGLASYPMKETFGEPLSDEIEENLNQDTSNGYSNGTSEDDIPIRKAL